MILTTSDPHRSPRHYAIIGAGAMGLSLAAMLAQRHRVTLIARDGEQRAQIHRHGVCVRGLINASARPDTVDAIARLADVTTLDGIFIATKTTAIDAVARDLHPVLNLLRRRSLYPLLISFQNGIEPGRSLKQHLQNAEVLRMVLNYGATKVSHHTAEVNLSAPPHIIGGPDETHFAHATALAATLSDCGLPTEPVKNIEPAVWTKGLLNAAMNPVAALLNATVGDVLDSPACLIVERLLDEGLAVASAEGIPLPATIRDQLWRTFEPARPHTPSMVSDVRNGQPSEVSQLNRQVIAHASRLNVPVPSHELITALIEAFDWRIFRGTARHALTGTRHEG